MSTQASEQIAKQQSQHISFIIMNSVKQLNCDLLTPNTSLYTKLAPTPLLHPYHQNSKGVGPNTDICTQFPHDFQLKCMNNIINNKSNQL